jgi:hypothetical protein
MNASVRVFLLGTLALPICVWAAPVGYGVNSDADGGDSLYEIDLSTGNATSKGKVFSLRCPSADLNCKDVEGLAFDGEGRLWGADDDSMLLLPFRSPGSGLVDDAGVVSLSGMGVRGRNDFGMTFTCDDELYMTSIAGASGSLHRVTLDGQASAMGSLGARISALASLGSPARLFGLSNGGDEPGDRTLYEIDPATGAASAIGALGKDVASYTQAGLGFDDSGQLWALTDRSEEEQPAGSQILRIDLASGAATVVATTSEIGFESLAIGRPSACDGSGEPPDEPGDGQDPEHRTAGIPTLDRAGIALVALLLALTGMLASRRTW